MVAVPLLSSCMIIGHLLRLYYLAHAFPSYEPVVGSPTDVAEMYTLMRMRIRLFLFAVTVKIEHEYISTYPCWAC